MRVSCIVFGIESVYQKVKSQIEHHYDIFAYCDFRNQGTTNVKHLMNIEEVVARSNEYEIALLVTDFAVQDITYLIDCGIPQYKIRSFLHERIMSKKKLGIDVPLKKFWGQELEDAVLALLFAEKDIHPGKVRYLEIGTNDPIFGNNSYYFYMLGGEGILVDPLPGARIMANMIRPDDRFIQAAVTGKSSSGRSIFYFDETVSAISSLNSEWMNASKKQGSHVVRKMDVQTIGINELLNNIGFVPNLLLIDAEGEDANILKSLDFNIYRPLVIVIESINRDLITYMNSKGYVWYADIRKVNCVFLRQY